MLDILIDKETVCDSLQLFYITCSGNLSNERRYFILQEATGISRYHVLTGKVDVLPLLFIWGGNCIAIDERGSIV